MNTIANHAGLIWAIADLLRGDKQSEHGRVILPLVVLRRLDCILEPTMGGWSDSGKLHLDVSRNFPSSRREQAIAAGRRQNQIAVFDLDTFTEIPTGGSGE